MPRRPMMYVAVVFAAVIFIGYYCLGIGQDTEPPVEESRTITGTVKDADIKRNATGEESIQLILETGDTRILLKCYDANVETACKYGIPGNEIKVSGILQSPPGRRNPGCFDYALYLKSLGIRYTMTVTSLDIIRGEKTLSGVLYIKRERFLDRLEDEAGAETAAMMRAILFGDKGMLDEEVLETFQKNGTAHILAVSGLHIGIIYGFILKLWPWRRGKVFFAFLSVFFGCYAILASFSPSVVRAVLMVFLHTFAKMTGRRYDMPSAAFLVMTVILAFNPFMLFNAGFQMSFLAILTMALITPYFRSFYQGVFLSGLAIQVGLCPYILFNFNYLSLIAVLINVPVISLAGLIVPLGLVSMVLGCEPLSWILQGLCNSLQMLNEILEIQGLTTFSVTSPSILLMAAYYLSLLTLFSEEGRLRIIRAGSCLKDRTAYIAKTFVVIVVISFAIHVVTDDGLSRCEIVFVDVGQGDCIHIRVDDEIFSKERNYLIDGGGSENYNVGKKVLRPYLLKNGVKSIDGAFVTHLHTDHYRGICELAQEGMIKKIYVYDCNRLKEDEIIEETGLTRDDIVYLHAGDRAEPGQKVQIDVLWPERKTEAEYTAMQKEEEDENESSLVFRINYEGLTLLTTGDMGEEGEKVLCEKYGNGIQSDILKVGHHGSRYSSSDEFLDRVSPGMAVIQVGKNSFGHPTPEVLNKLSERKIPVYRNDLHGAVGIEIADGEVNKNCTAVDNIRERDYNYTQ
ncbi:MAG: DNA internalization-related competence protein ComEC/Rec2 [Lentihominibacter sp.]|jgi:competence protein ComEC